MALSRLRQHFEDPLFTRVGYEMRPTAQAEGMRDIVAAAIATLEAILNYRLEFNADTTDRLFRVAFTDIGQIVMMPRFLEAFCRLAPQAAIEFSPITERTPELLETGALDLAVGFVPKMPDGFIQRAVFQESFVCLARASHSRITGPITLEQFKQEAHIVVITPSSTHLLIDRVMEEQKLRRRVAVKVPSFLLVAQLVATTDHLSVLPRRAGLAMAERDPSLVAHPLPFLLPGYSVTQYWHKRGAHDPGNQWLRQLFIELFGGSQS
jgi:DNA-binding transcriptional LysR family regulator